MAGERQGSDWIRVHGEAELAAGMAILESPCSGCGRAHVGVLLRQESEAGPCPFEHAWCRGWFVASSCSSSSGGPQCFYREMTRGHLFRLRPDAPAASDETTRPARVREMERAGR